MSVSAKALRGASKLEAEFLLRLSTLDDDPPQLVREYRFHPERRWRFDFAHLASKVAIEIDGGLYRRGGHTSKAGASRDREKDFEATMLGWTVIRLTPEMSRDRRKLEDIVALIESAMTP